GRLDFRRTVRRSLATGGVPADPQFRHPRPHRPEVWLLCDVSGSMATFSRFTLQFTHAMSMHFSRLRTFAFIDTIDEVTDFFGPGVDFASAVGRIATEAEVVWLDGHSDYGNALETFHRRYGSQLTPRTTVIITGDARNNYRPPRDAVLADVAKASRALLWLNPEPHLYWDTGDSTMSAYARHCTSVHEVRTLRPLEEFVETLTLRRGPNRYTSPCGAPIEQSAGQAGQRNRGKSEMGASILVVDDSAVIRRLIEVCLTAADLEIVTRDDG